MAVAAMLFVDFFEYVFMALFMLSTPVSCELACLNCSPFQFWDWRANPLRLSLLPFFHARQCPCNYFGGAENILGLNDSPCSNHESHSNISWR